MNGQNDNTPARPRWDFTGSGPGSRADAVVCAALVLFVAVWFAPGVLGGQVFFSEDTQGFFFASRAQLYASLHGRGFHLWDPLVGLGMPRLGDPQNGVLSPGALLFYLLPTATAYRYDAALMLGLIALGVYFLFRVRGTGPLAAAFGALSWSTMGIIVDHVQHPPVIETLLWLPYSLLCWELWRRHHCAVFAAAFAVLVACQAVAGSTQYFVYNGLLTCGWIAIDVWHAADRRAALRDAAEAVALGAAGILLGSWQLLPSIELVGIGHRALLAGSGFNDMYHLAPRELPLFYGQELYWFFAPPQLVYAAPARFGPSQSVLPLAFALLALGRKRLPEWGLVTVFLLGTLGAAGGVTTLLAHLIPPMAQIRAPMRMIVPAAFVLAWLAALGMQTLLDVRPNFGKRATAILCLLWMVGTTLYFKSNAQRFVDARAYDVPAAVANATPRIAMLTPRHSLGMPFLQNAGLIVGLPTLFTRAIIWPRNYFEATFASQLGSLDQTSKVEIVIGNSLAVLIHPDLPLLHAFRLQTVLDGAAGPSCVARPVAGAVDRFHLVTEVRVADTPAARETAAAATDWDAQRTAWVESADVAARVTAAVSAGPPTTVTVERDEPSQQVLTVTGGGGLLITSELFYPGWRVRVDGREADAVEADLALRAVVVPSGTHRVEWTYAPAWLRLAGAATVLALLLIGGVVGLRVQFRPPTTAADPACPDGE